jgi:hypothetical protein
MLKEQAVIDSVLQDFVFICSKLRSDTALFRQISLAIGGVLNGFGHSPTLLVSDSASNALRSRCFDFSKTWKPFFAKLSAEPNIRTCNEYKSYAARGEVLEAAFQQHQALRSLLFTLTGITSKATTAFDALTTESKSTLQPVCDELQSRAAELKKGEMRTTTQNIVAGDVPLSPLHIQSVMGEVYELRALLLQIKN